MAYLGKVPADVLIDPMVDSAAITDATIVTADLANDAVTSAKLAADSVDSSELIDGSVDNAHLAGSIAVNKTLLAGGTGLTLSTNTLNVDAAQTQITSVGTIGTGVWNGTAIASAYLDADTAHWSGGTFTGNLTIDTSDPILTLKSDGDGNANTGYVAWQSDDGTSEGWLGYGSTGDSAFKLYLPSGNDHIEFLPNATSSLTLTSSSATFAGTITSNSEWGYLDNSSSGNANFVIKASNSGNSRLYLGDVADVGVGFIDYDHGTSMTIGAGGAVGLTLAESDNTATFAGKVICNKHMAVGAETAISSWEDTDNEFSALHLGNAASVFGSGSGTTNSQAYLATNTYYNGEWKRIGAGEASMINLNDDGHMYFFHAAADAGTAGADGAITFKQSLKLDVAGYISVGKQSANEGRIDFESETSGATNARIRANGDSYLLGGNFGVRTNSPDLLSGEGLHVKAPTANKHCNIRLETASGADWEMFAVDNDNRLLFYDRNNTKYGLALDNGNVGVGTTSPVAPSGYGTTLSLASGGEGPAITFQDTDQTNQKFYILNQTGILKIGKMDDNGGGVTHRVQMTQGGALQVGDFDSASHFQVKANYAGEYIGKFWNDGDSENRYGIIVKCGHDDASDTNFAITIQDGNGTEQGYVTFTSGTVTYGAFTANHDAELPSSDNSNGYPYGTLVETESLSYKKQNNGNELERGIKYKVKKTSSAYSKKILGAYAGKYPTNMYENQHQIYVLGDGHILCNGEKGNIEVGDGICSSSTDGEGMKADKMSMIIGIAQEDVSFSGSESKLVAVQYGSQQFTPWGNA